MKRHFLFFPISTILILCIAALYLSACASAPTSASASMPLSQEITASAESRDEGLSLLQAIEQSAERIATELPARSRVAVLAFETDNPNLSTFIMEELAGALFDRGIEIADRQNLDIIYRELVFQMSGEVNDASVQSIGKFLGAEMVITGQMRPFGASYRFLTNAVHVESATRASVPRLTVRNDREMQSIIASFAQQTGAGAEAAAQTQVALAETRVAEVRAAAQRITSESSLPEVQAVAALAAEALAAAEARVAETRAEEARAAQARAAEEARLAEIRRAEEARRAEEIRAAEVAAAVARIPVPTGLSADTSYNTVQLTWNAVQGAASYVISRSTSAYGIYIEIARPNTNSYTDNSVTQGTSYHYRVSAVVNNITGRESTSLNTTTLTIITGTNVPGNTLTEKLTWLSRSGDSHNTYIIEVNNNETITPHTFNFRGGINITVVLRGVGANRTIRLQSHGTMFTVNTNVTFILDNNITLQGHGGNNRALVHVEGGILRMNAGATITGNTNTGYSGGGVYIGSGIFEMTGGTIISNISRHTGGGVVIIDGNFTMTGGTISGNTAGDGNVSSPSSISSSRGANRGGGVSAWGGTFTMRGGTITGNTAHEAGGGVFYRTGTFNKTGGTITGYSSDQINGNVVKDTDGFILARSGHAVFVSDNQRKETTSGQNDNLTQGGSRGTTGTWER